MWIFTKFSHPSSSVYILSMASYTMEYPCGQIGSTVLAILPPSFLCTSSNGRAQEAKKILDLV